jgi:tight adherence protein B
MLAFLIALIVLAILSISGFSWVIYQVLAKRKTDVSSLMASRIQAFHEPDAISLKVERIYSQLPFLDRFFRRFTLIEYLDKKIISADWKMTVSQFLGLTLVLFLGVFIVLFLITTPFFIALIFSLLIALLPLAWVYLKNKRRQTLLEKQLPDLLDFIARSMQAGHDFNSALRLASAESPKPIGDEFQIVFDEVNFGGSIHNAMKGLAERITCPDVRYFAIAVLINREIGGDIASLLKNVSTLIRERITFKDTIYAMTAEGRVSAIILAAMPFAVGLMIFFVNPSFISILWTDELGRKMFIYTFILMLFGGFWMYRMVQIKV